MTSNKINKIIAFLDETYILKNAKYKLCHDKKSIVKPSKTFTN